LLAGAAGNGAPFFAIQMAARAPIRKKPSREKARRERITKLLIGIEKKLDVENSKVTLADFIRLTQLERELEEEEQPREIIVTWKDPAEKRCGLK
jgi:hypothetical protein